LEYLVVERLYSNVHGARTSVGDDVTKAIPVELKTLASIKINPLEVGIDHVEIRIETGFEIAIRCCDYLRRKKKLLFADGKYFVSGHRELSAVCSRQE